MRGSDVAAAIYRISCACAVNIAVCVTLFSVPKEIPRKSHVFSSVCASCGSVLYIYNSVSTQDMLMELSSLIIRHTALSRHHLTPELVLRLITPSCPLWKATQEESPFKDPYWAFYWPGGQAAARYILDNAEIVKNRRVLDVGCGCGAGAIAAAKMKARHVLANDIDSYAIIATKINAELNQVNIEISAENVIGSKCDGFDTILIGDMFYDEEFAAILFKWLHKLNGLGKTIIIGDPGRHGLTESRRTHMTLLAKYNLPEESCIENHGFIDTTLWKINKKN